MCKRMNCCCYEVLSTCNTHICILSRNGNLTPKLYRMPYIFVVLKQYVDSINHIKDTIKAMKKDPEILATLNI